MRRRWVIFSTAAVRAGRSPISRSAKSLQWTTPGGVKVERPLAEIKSFDFSLGKVQYLSDLKPESVVWTPFFGQGQVSPTLERFYAPRMDRNFESNPLQLEKTIYSKGLALHSRTEIVYRLPGAYGRFKAVAGIDDAVAAERQRAVGDSRRRQGAVRLRRSAARNRRRISTSTSPACGG